MGVYNNNLDNEEHNLIVFVGDIINNYHVIDLLGQGISGRVYEVYQNNDSKNRYAMKIIKNKKIYRNQLDSLFSTFIILLSSFEE